MLDNIIEKRNRDESGLYELSLKISEKDFFVAYDEVDKESACDLLKKYLIYKQDDGRPKDVEINYSDQEKLVTINTKLHYLENKHTSQA